MTVVERYSFATEAAGAVLTPPSTTEGPGRVSGLAVPWGAVSADRGGYRDRFARGSLRLGDVVALAAHDPALVLGRMSAGTLALEDREDGVYFSLALPDTQAGRDVLTLLRRGDLGQCSFAAVLEREDWDYDADLRAPVRTVLAAELLEVSVVPLPAFANTTARAEA